MDPYIFGVFAIAYIFIFVWGLIKHQKTASAILFLVIIALIYDNGILALGHVIGEGQLLEYLSYGRFWLHALFTPTLILFSLYIMREANIRLAHKSWVGYVFGILMIVAIVLQYSFDLSGLKLSLQEPYGVLSYASTHKASGPPLMILLVMMALFIAAVALVWKRKWWWMLVGTIVMTVGSAIPFDIESNAMTNALELFLIATLMLTAIHFSKQAKNK